MEINMYIDRYKEIRLNLFKWRYELNVMYKLVLVLSFACLTGLMAQFRFYIPGLHVPVTGQVFAVMLSGVLLGLWGGVSQMMYLGIGAAGFPWFQGFSGGLSYMMGLTGGYLIGFVLAAFFIGYMVDRYVKSRSFINMTLLMLFSTFTFIYIPGVIWFYLCSGASFGLYEIIMMCVAPFVAIDIVKILIAASIATTITPKTAYAREIDS